MAARQPRRAAPRALRSAHTLLGAHGDSVSDLVIGGRTKPPHAVTPQLESSPVVVRRVHCAERRRTTLETAPAPGGPPPNLTATGKTATLEEQIATVLASAAGRVGARDREDLIALRCKRLARMYRELAAAGSPLEDISQLGERHATLLLRRWRERRRAASTIRSDWSILRVWCEALGKPGCVKLLREYWTDAPRASSARDPAVPPRHGDSVLLEALREDRDRTHYFVERLCKALRLSVQEALLFPVTAPTRAAKDTASARKLQAAMNAAGPEVDELLRDAAAFLAAADRPALIWPHLELAQAMRRHENRLAYLRRKRAESDDHA